MRPALLLAVLGLACSAPAALAAPSRGDTAARAPSPLAPPRHGPAQAGASADISANWAGYVVVGPGSTPTIASPDMSFTDVTGTWRQPPARCRSGESSSVAVWVGLGGYSDKAAALEQAGTSADCDEHGHATYYAWYELVPADSVTIRLTIAPGDVITTSVVVTGTDVLLQVKDRTRRTSSTRHLTMQGPDTTSAEWIAEAPAVCGGDGTCSQVALTDFGKVAFIRTYARGNGTPGTITGAAWLATRLELVPDTRRSYGAVSTATAGTAGANAWGLLPDGSGFTVTWKPHPTA